jgi:hypothetical protein
MAMSRVWSIAGTVCLRSTAHGELEVRRATFRAWRDPLGFDAELVEFRSYDGSHTVVGPGNEPLFTLRWRDGVGEMHGWNRPPRYGMTAADHDWFTLPVLLRAEAYPDLMERRWTREVKWALDCPQADRFIVDIDEELGIVRGLAGIAADDRPIRAVTIDVDHVTRSPEA